MINAGFDDGDHSFLEEEHLSTSLEPHQFDPRLTNSEFIRASLFDDQKIMEELFGICDSPISQHGPQPQFPPTTINDAASKVPTVAAYSETNSPPGLKRGYDAYLSSSSSANASGKSGIDGCHNTPPDATAAAAVRSYGGSTSGRENHPAPPVAKRRISHHHRQPLQASSVTPKSSPSNSSSDAQSPDYLGHSGAAVAETAAATGSASVGINSGYPMTIIGEYDKWSTGGQSFARQATIHEADAPPPSAFSSLGNTSHPALASDTRSIVDRTSEPLSLIPSLQHQQQTHLYQSQHPDDCVHPPPPLRFQLWDAAPALDLLEVEPCSRRVQPAGVAFKIEVDKGFQFSGKEGIWICQKKNHFQITCYVGVTGRQWAVAPGGASSGPQPVTGFRVNLYGVKAESPLDSLVSLEQSEVNRTKRLFAPIPVAMPGSGRTVRVVAQRLHFAATTMNNQRKRGDLHPDQRFFQLVLALEAHTETTVAPVQRFISRLIIVRASNPGQFDTAPAAPATSAAVASASENPPLTTPPPLPLKPPQSPLQYPQSHPVEYPVESEALEDSGGGAWITDRPGVVYYTGNVGINTPNPAEALTVNGNLQLRGSLLQPSDARIKSIERELSPADQLANISRIKIYSYSLSPNVSDTGVIAQEVAGILPDAVHTSSTERVPTGEPLLLVNKDRIYMENVGAVKQLGELTASLDCRIGELERMRSKLCRLRDSLRSSASSASSAVAATAASSGCIDDRSPRFKSVGTQSSPDLEAGLPWRPTPPSTPPPPPPPLLPPSSPKCSASPLAVPASASAATASAVANRCCEEESHRRNRRSFNQQQSTPQQQQQRRSSFRFNVVLVALLVILIVCFLGLASLLLVEKLLPHLSGTSMVGGRNSSSTTQSDFGGGSGAGGRSATQTGGSWPGLAPPLTKPPPTSAPFLPIGCSSTACPPVRCCRSENKSPPGNASSSGGSSDINLVGSAGGHNGGRDDTAADDATTDATFWELLGAQLLSPALGNWSLADAASLHCGSGGRRHRLLRYGRCTSSNLTFHVLLSNAFPLNARLSLRLRMSESLLAVRLCPPVTSLARCEGGAGGDEGGSGGSGSAAGGSGSAAGGSAADGSVAGGSCTPVPGEQQRGFDCDVSAASAHLLHLATFRLAAEVKENLCQLEASGLGREFVELTVLLERQEFGCEAN